MPRLPHHCSEHRTPYASHRCPGQAGISHPCIGQDQNPEFELRCQATPTGEELLFCPLPKDETGQPRSGDDHDALHKVVPSRLETRHWPSLRQSRLRSTDCTWWCSHGTGRHRLMGTATSLDITSTPTADGLCRASVPFVLRSCVEAFLRPRHTRYLDSVPQDPEHASVLRGTDPAHRELRRCPAHCLADDTSIFHSDDSDAARIVTEAADLAKRYARRSTLDVRALRGRGPPSWPVLRSPQGSREPEASDGTNHSPCWLRWTHT